MPQLLWRHLLSELIKMMVVTTGIIVTVIAFGAAAKPLAQNLIGADTIAKYVAVAMVPMLQFALPFAAGFAATLVLHRFVTDNEITAMSACGMSYRRILAPVAMLGVLLAALMFGLVGFVVPRFWVQMNALTAYDATRMLAAAVQRGEALAVEKGRMQIYADGVEVIAAPEDTGAQRRLLLHGVAAVELDEQNAPATEFTAENAAVDVYVTDSGPVVKVAFMNATVFKPSEGAIASVPFAEPEALVLQTGGYLGAKYQPMMDLLAVREDVDRAQIVQEAKTGLVGLLKLLEMWTCVQTHAEAEGGVTFAQRGSRREFVVSGSVLQDQALVPVAPDRALTVTELEDGVAMRRITCERVLLTPVTARGFEPSFALAAVGPRDTRDLQAGVPTRWPEKIHDLVPEHCTLRDWETASSLEALDLAARVAKDEKRIPRAALAKSMAQVKRVRQSVRWESDSHLMQRIAQTVAVPLMLLLGAVMATWMRRALPLTIYTLAALPAIANIILISGGQQTIKDGGTTTGTLLMWGGNTVAAIMLVWIWRRLVRN